MNKQEKQYTFWNPSLFLKIKTKSGALLYLLWLLPFLVVFSSEQEGFLHLETTKSCLYAVKSSVCMLFQLEGAACGTKLSYSIKCLNLMLKHWGISLAFSSACEPNTSCHKTYKWLPWSGTKLELECELEALRFLFLIGL